MTFRDMSALSAVSRKPYGRALKSAKRWLFLTHRWIGVATCLLCAIWFVSGLVMLYVPYPSWSDDERIAMLPPVDAESIKILPDDALDTAKAKGAPATFRIEMMAGEPVYRLTSPAGPVSISARTGKIITNVAQQDAERHLASVYPGMRPTLIALVDRDQWTVTRRFDAHRPLYQFALNDSADTLVYVSSRSGEIVQNATRAERFWNWLGAVPHWVYFTVIRKDGEVWRQAVMWTSGFAMIASFTGLWVGILRVRLRKRFANNRITPYVGWMKWHHLTGLVGGLFVLTWLASGWLSVNPFSLFARGPVTSTQMAAYAGVSDSPRTGATMAGLREHANAQATEIAFSWLNGRPLMLLQGPRGAILADPSGGKSISLSAAELAAAAQRIMPGVGVSNVDVLTEETLYWYSHHRRRPLPIVRVIFDDPGKTWLFLDPATGRVAGIMDKSARTYRWLFNFLHDYDLPILLRNQPARDILVWLLSIAGLVVSVSGIVVGWRTLVRTTAKRRR
jgi:uncharacterized iron-regulated membrane protein